MVSAMIANAVRHLAGCAYMRMSFYGALALVAAIGTGCDRQGPGRPPVVAASNGFLAAAARDLLGAGVEIVSLAEPGTCPGHLDVRPSQARQLRTARLLLRFDFQASLDRQAGGAKGPHIVPIEVAGGLCVPSTYLRACEQVADAAVEAGLLSRGDAELRLREISRAMDALGDELRAAVSQAGLESRAVVASDHQAEFCRFLGLEVAATLSTADRMTRSEIRRVLTDGARAGLVIANAPEGTDLADALASSIDARVVVFGNFPEPQAHGGRFEALVRDNVRRLIEGARS